jgi:hypothetical protein
MRYGTQRGIRGDLVILLVLFALFLFASPFFTWWATAQSAWYLAYLIWFGIIALTFWLQWRGDRDV